jgi:hypothetical protein
MNRELLDDITNLTAAWYELIGGDHHKDRDCHWYVETKWSYGNTPTYKVHHFGYILDTIEQVYDTYEEALHGLKETLESSIKYVKETTLSDND